MNIPLTVADPEISKRGPAPERGAPPEIAKKKKKKKKSRILGLKS
jgi:hypothetical protein